ncbi:MAG: site-2 protease family protein [Candidatus Thermoplasmatota archaeon]|nr:site-2 protease family protein [Candidatus Thermoplasmatota archaeon]
MVKERKIYTSFHDIPPREYMYFPKGAIEIGKPGKFSVIEIQHILISISVLTIAFTFSLTKNSLITLFGNLSIFPTGMLMSFLGILTAFFFHEISHKIVAQKYGLWAEYRMYPIGLLLAFILSITIGFVFAAPGAVMFRGGSREFETGKIALSGPLANLVVSVIALFLFFYVFFESSIINKIVGFICIINAIMATFNLLPLGPLDGVKIVRWNATVWAVLLIISISVMTRMLLFLRLFSF